MQKNTLRANSLLLTTAAIWGFAFVAQRIGIRYVGSFTFNGIRFALGSLSLVPLILFFSRNKRAPQKKPVFANPWPAGLLAGVVLFTAASLQQVGLAETTAGKAAFITGLYIALVPLMGLFLRHRIQTVTWIGIAITTAGLYLLSVTQQFTIARGDLLELIGAFFWAVHILLIDHFSQKTDALKLSAIQFLTCSILSLIVAVAFEPIRLSGIYAALIPILYGGLCSVGIAYTLQVVGQKHAKPFHAAIILSMETVFASLGGWLILHENLGVRGYLGCLMMLAGMLLAQFPGVATKTDQERIST